MLKFIVWCQTKFESLIDDANSVKHARIKSKTPSFISVLLGWLIISVIIQLVGMSTILEVSQKNLLLFWQLGIIISLIGSIIAYFIVFSMWPAVKKLTPTIFGGKSKSDSWRKHWVRNILVGLGVGVSIFILLAIVGIGLEQIMPKTTSKSSFKNSLTVMSMLGVKSLSVTNVIFSIITVVSTVLIIPVLEEVFYRRIVFKLLKPKIDNILAYHKYNKRFKTAKFAADEVVALADQTSNGVKQYYTIMNSKSCYDIIGRTLTCEKVIENNSVDWLDDIDTVEKFDNTVLCEPEALIMWSDLYDNEKTQRLQTILTVVFNGLIFGVMHAITATDVYNMTVAVLTMTIFGAILTYERMRTKTIRTTAITHITYNALVLGLSCLSLI